MNEKKEVEDFIFSLSPYFTSFDAERIYFFLFAVCLVCDCVHKSFHCFYFCTCSSVFRVYKSVFFIIIVVAPKLLQFIRSFLTLYVLINASIGRFIWRDVKFIKTDVLKWYLESFFCRWSEDSFRFVPSNSGTRDGYNANVFMSSEKKINKFSRTNKKWWNDKDNVLKERRKKRIFENNIWTHLHTNCLLYVSGRDGIELKYCENIEGETILKVNTQKKKYKWTQFNGWKAFVIFPSCKSQNNLLIIIHNLFVHRSFSHTIENLFATTQTCKMTLKYVFARSF